MKKYMIWITLIAMSLTLCACRPEAQAGGAGSSPTDGTGVTEETVGEGAQVDENAENSESGALEGAEGEESAENTLTPEESEEGTEVTETVPAENEEEAEVTLPATAEDPALRAEADRIRKEQGEYEYQKYCIEKDIKVYSKYEIDEDFVNNEVIVYLKKSASAINQPMPTFEGLEYQNVVEDTYYTDVLDYEFSRSFTITLKTNDKQSVLDAIKKLEAIDYVLCAQVNHKGYSD